MPRHDRDAPPGRRDRGGRRGSQCKKEKTPESRSLPRQARSTARGRGGGRGEGRKEGGWFAGARQGRPAWHWR